MIDLSDNHSRPIGKRRFFTDRMDLMAPFTILGVCRLRQWPIWVSAVTVVSLCFLSHSIRSSSAVILAPDSRSFLAAFLLLGWMIAASGSRGTSQWNAVSDPNVVAISSQHRFLFILSAVVGVVVADVIVGMGAIAVLIVGLKWAFDSPAEVIALTAIAIPLLVAVSLQMELALSFGNRSVALILTALVTGATVVKAAWTSSIPQNVAGGLLFPVSGVLRATEVPLGFELAARAILAGALYDLALLAALLALRPIRARGSHEDRDR